MGRPTTSSRPSTPATAGRCRPCTPTAPRGRSSASRRSSWRAASRCRSRPSRRTSPPPSTTSSTSSAGGRSATSPRSSASTGTTPTRPIRARADLRAWKGRSPWVMSCRASRRAARGGGSVACCLGRVVVRPWFLLGSSPSPRRFAGGGAWLLLTARAQRGRDRRPRARPGDGRRPSGSAPMKVVSQRSPRSPGTSPRSRGQREEGGPLRRLRLRRHLGARASPRDPPPEKMNPAWERWEARHAADGPLGVDATRPGRVPRSISRAVSKLLKEAELVVAATDAGREGEHIFRLIYQHSRSKRRCSGSGSARSRTRRSARASPPSARERLRRARRGRGRPGACRLARRPQLHPRLHPQERQQVHDRPRPDADARAPRAAASRDRGLQADALCRDRRDARSRLPGEAPPRRQAPYRGPRPREGDARGDHPFPRPRSRSSRRRRCAPRPPPSSTSSPSRRRRTRFGLTAARVLELAQELYERSTSRTPAPRAATSRRTW